MSLVVFASCSDDDDNNNQTEENKEEVAVVEEGDEEITRTNVIINELSYAGTGTDWVEFYNPTGETIDITNYWVCLGPGAYAEIENLTVISGNTVLESGSFLTLDLSNGETTFELPDENAGFGIYKNNAGFGNVENIVDFVQYGESGSARENVAVEAELWTAGDFLPTVSSIDNTIVYEGTGFGVESWSETITPTVGDDNEFTAP